MYKFLLAFSLLIFISACSPSATSTPSALPITPAASATPAWMPCTLVGGGSESANALKSTLSENEHAIGPVDVPVTILVYSDFQCSVCAFVASSLNQVRQANPELVRLVFRYLPLTDIYDKTLLAIQAAEAAGLQDRFWEMHDLLFQKQSEWTGLAPDAFHAWEHAQAGLLGLNAAQFHSDFEGEAVQSVVTQAVQFAGGISQPSLPMLFINSTTPYTGPVDFPNLESVVNLTALSQSQFSACPPLEIEPHRQYLATLHTTRGDMVVQLFPDKALLAVNSFVFLARSGWYDGISFYEVTASVAQTGDPSNTGLGNPGYLFTVETSSVLKFDRPGVVALMNDGPETNGSRFFITLDATPQLDGQYTIIGQVLSGMDVLSGLAPREPLPGQYLPPGDLLLQISIEEK